MMPDTRRRFLKFLGLSAPAAMATVIVPKAAEAAKPTDCFRFACDCGENIVLPVPKDIGELVVTNCPQCKHLWHFRWQGDCFKAWD